MITYRLATKQDNEQLIHLTASAGMDGEISLRIDREPDFFELLNMRGETKVFVALDEETIIGAICVSLQQVYVDGKIYPLQYIGDFKVAAAYRNKGIGLKLCDNMADYVISCDSDLAFLNVSKGNNKPVTFFRNRPGVPDFDNIGIFNIYQFIGIKKKFLLLGYEIISTPVTDELLTFLNAHHSKYELGHVITKERIAGTEIFIIRHTGNIVAAMCLTDTMNMKQNVVTRIDWKMKYLVKFLNAVSGIIGISKMPVLNEPVRMMYIKYLAVNKPGKTLVKLLVNYARNIVYEKNYSFVSIGLHEKDALNLCFKGLLKITFKSVGMLLSIKDNRALIEKVKEGIPFEDYSIV